MDADFKIVMIKNGNYKHSGITDKILEAYFAIYNKFGIGFCESIYEKALLIELDKRLLKFEQQKNIKVHYDGQLIGDFYADVIVEDCVILELKAIESLRPEHEVQLVNYLKATEVEEGLLLNFGSKPQCKRKVFSISRKNLKS